MFQKNDYKGVVYPKGVRLRHIEQAQDRLQKLIASKHNSVEDVAQKALIDYKLLELLWTVYIPEEKFFDFSSFLKTESGVKHYFEDLKIQKAWLKLKQRFYQVEATNLAKKDGYI